MKFRHLIIAIALLLFCTGLNTDAQAQGWRDHSYCKARNCCNDGHYRGKYYHRFMKRSCNFGYRRDYYAKADSFFKEREGKYYHTYKKQDDDNEGYYHYYRNNNKLYYDRYFDDNYRPQVDNNK